MNQGVSINDVEFPNVPLINMSNYSTFVTLDTITCITMQCVSINDVAFPLHLYHAYLFLVVTDAINAVCKYQ